MVGQFVTLCTIPDICSDPYFSYYFDPDPGTHFSERSDPNQHCHPETKAVFLNAFSRSFNNFPGMI